MLSKAAISSFYLCENEEHKKLNSGNAETLSAIKMKARTGGEKGIPL